MIGGVPDEGCPGVASSASWWREPCLSTGALRRDVPCRERVIAGCDKAWESARDVRRRTRDGFPDALAGREGSFATGSPRVGKTWLWAPSFLPARGHPVNEKTEP